MVKTRKWLKWDLESIPEYKKDKLKKELNECLHIIQKYVDCQHNSYSNLMLIAFDLVKRTVSENYTIDDMISNNEVIELVSQPRFDKTSYILAHQLIQAFRPLSKDDYVYYVLMGMHKDEPKKLIQHVKNIQRTKNSITFEMFGTTYVISKKYSHSNDYNEVVRSTILKDPKSITRRFE